MHRGQLQVESSCGGDEGPAGTTMTITLPVPGASPGGAATPHEGAGHE
jgi:signal transduction histidine kinase